MLSFSVLKKRIMNPLNDRTKLLKNSFVPRFSFRRFIFNWYWIVFNNLNIVRDVDNAWAGKILTAISAEFFAFCNSFFTFWTFFIWFDVHFLATMAAELLRIKSRLITSWALFQFTTLLIWVEMIMS